VHQRSAIEGTISELARGHGLRRSRYRGFAKVELQNLFITTAGNVKRWLQAILEAIESSLQFLSRTNLLFGVRCLLLATPVGLASCSFVSPQGTLIIKSGGNYQGSSAESKV
jgi:Transposase DDE domain